MVKDLCFNGIMANTDKYSSPIPLVGLYIAAASMVCALLILYDVWAGFRRRMYWFPCRFFSINSVTLTLISTAAKIPVDLTTNMPSKQDQLSKLTGTVFICVCMNFMLPSITTNAEFESYANVTALSIFVITVVVNICMQMATGVIFSFKAEHVIILICMVALLLRFWYLVISINALKNDRADKGAELIRNGEEKMLARLRLCYIYSYHSCLQLYSCIKPQLGDASFVCVTCSIVFVQATLRSLALKEFKFCKGVSDYGWSMWWVVASQIFTVAVVTFAVGCRWLVHLFHPYNKMDEAGNHKTYLQLQYLFSLRNFPNFMEKIFKTLIYLPLLAIHFVLVTLTMMVEFVFVVTRLSFIAMVVICGSLCCSWKWKPLEDKLDEKSEVFEKQLRLHHVTVVNWVLKKGVADMERWMKRNEQVSLKHLTCLLSTVLPSRESSFYVGLNGEGVRVSLLSLKSLVEIANIVIAPANQDKVSLANILDEVFEILHFIENNVNIGSSSDRLQSMLAKVTCKYGLTSGYGQFVLEQNWDLENRKVNFKFIEKPVWGVSRPVDSASICIQKEISLVSDLINYRSDESSEVVYGRIVQLFVDMLHAFLAQLPMAIFTHIVESSLEEQQQSVRLCLGYMCKLQSVESHVRFSLPPEANITGFFHTQTSLRCPREQDGSTLSLNIAQAVEDDGEIQEEEQALEQQV